MSIQFQPNMLNPNVSVIIPTYNRVSMLEEALASVVYQEFDGIVEIIVVDDNSQDGTSEFVSQQYPYVRLISLKENVGPSAARNRAILEAKGKYLAFLDSDDLWKTNYLKVQVAAIERVERCFCVSDLLVWDMITNLKQVQVQKPNLKKYESFIHNLLVSTFIKTLSSVIVPAKAFEEIGLFDEKLKSGEDADFYLRCLLADYHLIFTKLPLAIKREHEQGQLTDPKHLKLRERCRFIRIKKFYALAEGRSDIIPVRRIYAETHAFFASLYFKNNNFLYWFTSSTAIVYNSSLGHALSNMFADIKNLLKSKIKSKLMYNHIKFK